MRRERSKKRPARRGDEGVALLLGLVFIVLLVAIVVEFAFDAQVEASLASNTDGYFQASVAARSAVAEGIALLAQDLYPPTDLDTFEGVDPSLIDSVMDPWSQGVMMKPINDATMRTTVADEFGKINLNALLIPREDGGYDENTLLIEAVRLFFEFRDEEIETNPTDAILDWLDGAEDDGERPEGAEAEYYEGLEIPYPVKDGPMGSVEELLLIKGMTPELYYGTPAEDEEEHWERPIGPLSNFFTVYGDWEGKVNANTADYWVLRAVLEAWSSAGSVSVIPENESYRIYSQAQEEQLPFDSVSALGLPSPQTRRATRNTVNPTVDLDGDGIADPAEDEQDAQDPESRGAEDLFTVRSNIFRIYGDGMKDEALVRIESFVWRTPIDPSDLNGGGPQERFRVLSWRMIR